VQTSPGIRNSRCLGACFGRASVMALCIAAVATQTASGDVPGAQTSDSVTIPLGPLKFTAGPQSDGTLGATLKGGATGTLYRLWAGPPGCDNDTKDVVPFCNQGDLALTFDVDAAWSTNISGSTSTASSNKNNATLTFDPSLYWILGQKDLTPRAQHIHNCAVAEKAAGGKVPNDPDCKWILDHLEYSHYLVVASYPDLEYRYGHFTVSGTDYTANQLIYGGGVRLLYPSIINSVFANWPYISAAYTSATNYGASNLPVSTATPNHFLVLNERVELNLPGVRERLKVGVLILADVTESHPISSSLGPSWQTAKLFQLIIDTGSTTGLKPALTYRSGTDRGMTYDRQIIFGVLWDIWSGTPTH
jgi:hypothetical protein